MSARLILFFWNVVQSRALFFHISLFLYSLHKRAPLGGHLLLHKLHGFELRVMLVVQEDFLLSERLLLKLNKSLVKQIVRFLPLSILLSRDGLLKELVLLVSQAAQLIGRFVNFLGTVILALDKLIDFLRHFLIEFVDFSNLLFSEFLSVLRLDLLLALSKSGSTYIEFIKLISAICDGIHGRLTVDKVLDLNLKHLGKLLSRQVVYISLCELNINRSTLLDKVLLRILLGLGFFLLLIFSNELRKERLRIHDL